MVRFETDRAVVRDVVEGDMDIMFSIYTQEKNMRYISGGRYDWTIFAVSYTHLTLPTKLEV